ncbi:MAG TPA: alpha/beta hydrolase [Candidatus Nanopelagicales bacterium]|nr:alpha/beta hydrolase [Candidatus Nanopelagicales bacterium]
MTRGRIAAAALAACALLAACGSTATNVPTPTASVSPSSSVFVPDSGDGTVSADIHLPTSADKSRPVPLIVTIPGGSWKRSDRAYLEPLAKQLASVGNVVVNATYRAGDMGAQFPVPLQDVRCDVGYAAAQAKAAGYTPGPVVLVGHSAGGHLVALAGVSGDALAAPCADPVPHIDAVVGLAGIYDARHFTDLLTPFFGVPVDDAPALWDAGDPLHYVQAGAVPKPLSVLLLQGSDDAVVPVTQPQVFEQALLAHGIPAQLDVLPGVDHMGVVDPAVVAGRIALFVRGLQSTYSVTPSG